MIADLYHVQEGSMPEVHQNLTRQFEVVSQNGAPRRVRANPRGFLNRNFITYLASYGLDLNKAQIRQVNSSSGGHANLRFLANLSHADLINRLPSN